METTESVLENFFSHIESRGQQDAHKIRNYPQPGQADLLEYEVVFIGTLHGPYDYVRRGAGSGILKKIANRIPNMQRFRISGRSISKSCKVSVPAQHRIIMAVALTWL